MNLSIKIKLLIVDFIFVITLLLAQMLVFWNIIPLVFTNTPPERIILSFIVLAFWLVIYNTISLYVFLAPLQKIKKYFKKIGAGDLTADIPAGRDEIGEIVNAINGMKNDFKKHVSALNLAQEIEKRKSEFTLIASHQLRAPLTAINWALDSLLKDKTMPSKSQKEFLDIAKEAAEQAISLSEGLLSIAREESQEHTASQLKLVNLAEIVNDTIKELAYLVRKKRITIKRLFDEQLPTLHVQPAKIKSVAQCFIENAINYSKEQSEIIITMRSKEDMVEFAVTNTGFGIRKSEQKNIFHKFYRGREALHAKTAGSGLGLYFAKNIIENYGGKLWFASKPGKTTTFYFSVPFDSAVKSNQRLD